MKNKKGKTLAGRLSRKILKWMLLLAVVLSCVVISITSKVTSKFFTESYYDRTLLNKEYTRRVISDVYVAVINNIYYLEHSLDKPDNHKEVMKRIVSSGTRIRSCGVSFIEDYYYPEKGHRFCPFAWRSPVNLDVVDAADMGDSSLDYLKAQWFRDIIENDSAQWSEPFYDGYDETTTLIAYMVPVHDPSGRVVAALGADISLDWLTAKLSETDSTLNANAMFISTLPKERSYSFIVNNDGKFITHPDVKHIMKDNFFNHIDNDKEQELITAIKNGMKKDHGHFEECAFDSEECYVFCTPVKYTNWTMVTIVPWKSIERIGYIYGIVSMLVILLVMAVILVVCHYSMRSVTQSIRQIIRATNHIAKGKFDMPMPEIHHDDELRELCEAMDNMQYSIKRFADEHNTARNGKNRD